MAAAVLAAFLVSGPARSQSLPEQDFGEPWNSVGVGVRAIGMGSAFTAVSDDLSGVYWNPAGLIRMKDTQLGLMTGGPYVMRNTSAKKMSFPQWLDNLASIGFITTAFKPWAAGLSRVRGFHPESLVPWQEDYYMGTFVLPFNLERTGGLGVNVKYLQSDRMYRQFVPPVVYYDDSSFTFGKVSGWALDAGLIYAIPLPLRDRYRQLNIGLMARNLVGRKQVGNTQTELPRQAQLGLAFILDDLIPRERSIIAMDLSSAVLSDLGATSSQLRVGYEQWFLQNFGALRLGYATPLPAYDRTLVATKYLFQGRPVFTGGLTILLKDFQLDLAATYPPQSQGLFSYKSYYPDGTLDPDHSLLETPIRYIPPNSEIMPVETARVYLQVTWHWRSPSPPPFGRVSVEPLVFSPKKGEVAVFTIDYRDEVGLESWVLEIRNSARMPVRVFSGKGAPPARLVWDGLDDRFNLAQDDDHTFTLKLRNQEGVETITPTQAFRIFTPDVQTKGDPTLIWRLHEEQLRKELAEKARLDDELSDRLNLSRTAGGEVPSPVPSGSTLTQ